MTPHDEHLEAAARILGARGGAAGRGKPKPARTPEAAARRTANLPKDGGRKPLPRCPACAALPGPIRRRCFFCKHPPRPQDASLQARPRQERVDKYNYVRGDAPPTPWSAGRA